jgi:hypothetical protein
MQLPNDTTSGYPAPLLFAHPSGECFHVLSIVLTKTLSLVVPSGRENQHMESHNLCSCFSILVCVVSLE